MKLAAVRIIIALRKDVAATRAILSQSLLDQKQLFLSMVLNEVEKSAHTTNKSYEETGASATSSIPHNIEVLRAMAQRLRAEIPNTHQSDADSEYEAAQVTDVNLRRQEESLEKIKITKLMGSFNSKDEEDGDNE
ncbi:hypothetical protein FRC12_018122 [Ceratobasidium sp. 428]|nr:hypothetical protein FRC12_018122 [Ceratobasidium sp. 428]